MNLLVQIRLWWHRINEDYHLRLARDARQKIRREEHKARMAQARYEEIVRMR